MMLVPPFVNNVMLNVLLVTNIQVVILVLPEESMPQIVYVQMECGLTLIGFVNIVTTCV